MLSENIYSEEELISSLERSGFEVNILVEGKDDIIIFRTLENFLEVNVIGVGGRNTILNIFSKQKRGEILQNKKIIFIADKDIWVNTGIPEKYESDKLIFTSGYSIENDVFIDAGCDKIIEGSSEKSIYIEGLHRFLSWYALALQYTVNNTGTDEDFLRKRSIGTHPEQVMNNFEEFFQLSEGEVYPEDLFEELKNNTNKLLRGKSLMAIFTKFFRHHNSRALFEVVSVNPKSCVSSIFDKVKQLIN